MRIYEEYTVVRNGRPVTFCGCGRPDDNLLTDLDPKDIAVVGKWIKDHVFKSDSVGKANTLALKLAIDKDTGVYLTLNQIKDAMLLAGYTPVDENKFSWNFRILVAGHDINNPNPFLGWVAERYLQEDSPAGTFVCDMLGDKNFPVFATKGVIERYLKYYHGRGVMFGADQDIMNIFYSLWEEYSRNA